MIDLRSDTITRPTDGMRRAMAAADVGDDVWGEDPTVRRLEDRTAEILGKDAAVFMPSGTMSNQIAVRCHTEPGDELFIHGESHIYYYEGGGPAALSGVTCCLLPGRRGIFSADELRSAIRPPDVHKPHAKLVCIENTHNRGGGSVWPIEQIASVASAARDAGLKLHMDGARLWNAAVASGNSERQFAAFFDSVSVCFSKGLGAPVGSALLGSADFCQRARRFRKMFGGGMRQAGIIAAGALYALEHHRPRLAEDHANAKAMAAELAGIPGLSVNIEEVETNIVVIHTGTIPAADMVTRLKSRGVLVGAMAAHRLRAVTSLEFSGSSIRDVAAAFRAATEFRSGL